MFAAGSVPAGGIRLGVPALAVTLLAAALWEWGVMRTEARRLLVDLGFGRARWRGVAPAALVAAAVPAYLPIYSAGVAPLKLANGWPLLAVGGLFAYHGLAEELAWRGYVFRRLREGRSFWRAVLWTMPLLAATHVPIVVTAGPLIGVVAMIVAAVTCVPFAHLYERGGRTIWAPALVHAAIDGFKLVTPANGTFPVSFSLGLALVSVVVPFLAFADRGERRSGAQPRPAT